MTAQSDIGIVELKACPFCGGEAVVDDFCTNYRCDAKPLWFVGCLNEDCPLSEATGQCDEDKNKAITSWNTRDPIITEMVEALEMWRGLVVEGGVPRYTVTPGAALNTLVGWTDTTLAKVRGK